jgi:hypothetical protein
VAQTVSATLRRNAGTTERVFDHGLALCTALGYGSANYSKQSDPAALDARL